MNIGIIIINFNGISDTKECLKSIQHLDFRKKVHVFLIENNPHNCIREDFLNKLDLKITQVINIENKGFAEGNNIGIKKAIYAGCEYIALINNDTVFVDDSLLKVINFMEKNSEYGITGIINYYYNNPVKIWQAGFKSNLIFGFTKKIKVSKTVPDVVQADYVPGSSLVIRKNVFEKIGFIDERFFAYYEEIDFCIRAKKKKINIGFLNESKILHKVGKSSTSSVKLYLRTRNKLLFYQKHGSVIGYVIALTLHLIISFKRIIFSKNKKSKMIKALILGFKDHFNDNYYIGSIQYLN